MTEYDKGDRSKIAILGVTYFFNGPEGQSKYYFLVSNFRHTVQMKNKKKQKTISKYQKINKKSDNNQEKYEGRHLSSTHHSRYSYPIFRAHRLFKRRIESVSRTCKLDGRLELKESP